MSLEFWVGAVVPGSGALLSSPTWAWACSMRVFLCVYTCTYYVHVYTVRMCVYVDMRVGFCVCIIAWLIPL